MEIEERNIGKDTSREKILRLQYLLAEKEKEVEDRRYADEIFSSFIRDTYHMSHDEFMKALVSFLSSILRVRYAFISEIIRPQQKTARTLAFYSNGTFMENFEYDLTGTPCSEVFNDRSLRFYPNEVERLFPNDHMLLKMGVESFAGIPLYGFDENVLGILVIMDDHEFKDIVRMKALMEIIAIRASSELESRKTKQELFKFKSIVHNSPAMVCITDQNGMIEFVNPRFTEITGFTPEEMMGKNASDLCSLSPNECKKMWNNLVSGKKWEGTFHNTKKDGSDYWERAFISTIMDERGKVKNFIKISVDVSDLRKNEQELKIFSKIIEQSVNIVFITDPDGVIQYVNPMFEEVTGYSSEEASDKKPNILKSGEVSIQEYQLLWSMLKAGKTWRGIFKNRKKNGDFYWANNVVSPIMDEKGKITHFLAIQEDITERKKAEDQIKHLISHDTLTGLFNRTQFIHSMKSWIDEASRSRRKGVLILLDLDHFRIVNDTYGHARGDMILNSVAKIMDETVQELYNSKCMDNYAGYLTGHLDSDEFAVFLPDCDEKEGLVSAEKIRNALENMRLLDLQSRVTASIGVAVYPEHGDTASELLKSADLAIYKAKDLGKNVCRIFRPEDRELEKIHERLEWKDRIMNALEEDRFEPWFQPILDLRTDNICHYETLVRLRNKEGQILSPAMFIDVAERFKITGLIDKVMIRKAMIIQAEARNTGKDFNISMNLSGRDLNEEGFLRFIESQILNTGADPDHLIFEITETEAVHNIDSAIKFIDAVRNIGCHFALDDFGVGFSSFLYLKMMQVDYIKIDGTFIKALHENTVDQLFVKSIGNVAREMGIRTIAEFVETRESLDMLREFGIDYAQGYLIGKPSPDYLKNP